MAGERTGPSPEARRAHRRLKRALRRRQRLARPDKKTEAPRVATCPKCDHKFLSRYELCVAICKCGWLLKIEPFWGAVSVDDVQRVAEPERDNGDQTQYPKLVKEAIMKVYQNWERRRLIVIKVDQLAGKYEVRYASHVSELIERELAGNG